MTVLGKARPRIRPTGAMIGGLPTYTPAQLALAKPGTKYADYRRFIENRRGVTAGSKWPGRGGPGLPTYESLIRQVQLETPQQIEARAGRMTAAQVAAQKGLVLDEAARARAEALNRMKALSAAGRAAASMNQGLFGAVGGEYNRAATELANLATGGVGDVTQQTGADVAAMNEALARVGAPGIEATGAMAGPAQAGVAAFQGGGLPAQRLAEQGQAAQFGLAGLVGAQNLRATQEAASAYSQAGREIAGKRYDALREIARGRPEMAAKHLEQLQGAQRQQMALAMSLIEARRNALNRGFEQSVTKQELKNQTAAVKAEAKAAEAELKRKAEEANIEYGRIDSPASKAAGFLVDRAGRPILNANGKRIPVAKSAAGGKNAAGLTPLQQQKQVEKARNLAETLFYGYKNVGGKRIPATQSGDFDPDNPDTYGSGEVRYQDALKRIRQLGVPQAQATAMLNEYYERGDLGRPLFNATEQKRIKARLNKDFGPAQGKKQWNRAITNILRALDAGQGETADHLIDDLLGFAR